MEKPGSDQYEQEAGARDQDSRGSDSLEEDDPEPDIGVEQYIPSGKGGNMDNPNPSLAAQALEKQADGRPSAEGLGKISIDGGQPSSERGTDVIMHSRVSLREMYSRTLAEQEESPSAQEQIAGGLVEQMGCPGEVARDLATLRLYDVAILISMFRCQRSLLRACFA